MLTSTIVDSTNPIAKPPARRLDHLRALEAESIHIIREVVAEFERPVMLYSIGKDSSVMLRLAQKAFYPGPIPFPLLHIDTTYKFREMIEFRDWYADHVGARLIVHTNEAAIADGTQPFAVGTQRCCGLLKTRALLDALGTESSTQRSAALAATRSDRGPRSESSRCAIRRASGIPKRQRPELWHHLNSRLNPGESIRVFPLSNWTELDVWQYIHEEDIPIVPLYFAREREVIVRGNSLLLLEQPFVPLHDGEQPQRVMCRMRSLGCSPCTGAVRSEADTVAKIIAELVTVRQSERQLRDHRPRPGRLDGSQEARGLLLMSGLLRICTAGSVDDGKSTLIGRLLYDSRGVYEDQISSVEKASKNRTAGPIDFSLFTDGLQAEREQGITIDVAYRYFATARRKFILADTPGHEQYTRNMATGASTAEVAILLVDARHGVREQTDRHARIARLLGIGHFVLAVNKMDLVELRPERVRVRSRRLRQAAFRREVTHAIPLSALDGDNVIGPSARTPWFEGQALLPYPGNRRSRTRARRGCVPDAGAARRPARSARSAAMPGRSSPATSALGDPLTIFPSGVYQRRSNGS